MPPSVSTGGGLNRFTRPISRTNLSKLVTDSILNGQPRERVVHGFERSERILAGAVRSGGEIHEAVFDCRM